MQKYQNCCFYIVSVPCWFRPYRVSTGERAISCDVSCEQAISCDVSCELAILCDVSCELAISCDVSCELAISCDVSCEMVVCAVLCDQTVNA